MISILGNWKDFMKRNHVSGTLQTIDRKGAHRTCQRHLGFFLELDNTLALLGASLNILLEIFDDLRSNKNTYYLT